MAFWGVEVRPGKPYTHRHNPSHGRLRICQATLGSCDASTRTVVQCNVGNKTPVILCSLNPKLAEMCHLEIELEEDDEVLFSVLGQSSVHLSGYYLRSSSKCSAGGEEESESYGEDVGESDTDEEDVVSDDSYESDFIDDGEVAVSEDKYGSDFIDDSDVCSTRYRHKQEAVQRHAGKVERRRCLKKKNQVDNNHDSPYKPPIRRNASSIFDSGSEDEDNMPLSHSLPKKGNRKASIVIKTENVQPSEDEGKVSMEIKTENDQSNDVTRKESNARKRKGGAIHQDPASPMDLTVNGSSVSKQEAEVKKKSKKKKRTPLEAEDGKHSISTRTLENGLIIEDLTPRNLGAKMASSGSKVYISYVGMLQDGKVVESNVGEKPYKFKLGSGEAFFGCDGGICGMHVGDKRRLTIPPSMCHGDKAERKIPKNCSIIYEVELVKVR